MVLAKRRWFTCGKQIPSNISVTYSSYVLKSRPTSQMNIVTKNQAFETVSQNDIKLFTTLECSYKTFHRNWKLLSFSVYYAIYIHSLKEIFKSPWYLLLNNIFIYSDKEPEIKVGVNEFSVLWSIRLNMTIPKWKLYFERWYKKNPAWFRPSRFNSRCTHHGLETGM